MKKVYCKNCENFRPGISDRCSIVVPYKKTNIQTGVTTEYRPNLVCSEANRNNNCKFYNKNYKETTMKQLELEHKKGKIKTTLIVIGIVLLPLLGVVLHAVLALK